jgi:uncharacterized membrane protein YqjE
LELLISGTLGPVSRIQEEVDQMKAEFIQNEEVSATRRESFGELLGQLASQSAALVRDEIDLAKQEFREKVKSFRTGIVVVALGAVLGLIALQALFAALILGLSTIVSPAVAALATGVALAIIGGTAAFSGIRILKNTKLKPEETIQSLKEDKEWLKEMT